MKFAYKDLKGVIKVGDRVRAIEGCKNPCAHLNNDGSNILTITQVDEYIFWINNCSHFYKEDGYLDLIDYKKTMKDVEYGDIVVDKDGGKRKVVGRCGDVVFLSSYNNYDEASGLSLHWKELQENGYTIEGQLKEACETHANAMVLLASAMGNPVEYRKIESKEMCSHIDDLHLFKKT